MNDSRLALSITHADGTTTRWGGDEPGAGDVPRGLKFGTVMPGGFKDLSCSLARRIDIDYPDLSLFDDVRAYGPGNETAWEGRQQQFPRQQSADFSIDVGAVGWSSHLADDASFREIYVDRDFGSWGDIPLSRKVANAGSIAMGDFSWSAGIGSLVVALPNQALGAQTLAETAYTDSPLKKAVLYYNGSVTGLPSGWIIRITASDVESANGDTYTPAFDGSLHGLGLTTVRRYLRLYLWSNGNAATPAAGSLIRLSQIAVIGNHGLTSQPITGEPPGFLASDVIADVVRRAAPKLTFTTGSGGSIQPTTFAVPHLVFPDPTTASDALQLVNGYHLYNWAVWDGKTFYFQPPDSSLDTVWEARISDGAQIQLEGDQGADLFNGVIVTYTDATGVARSVGPPGSATDAQDASLENTDPVNPVNAAGLTKWETINVSVPTTQAGAIQLGFVWLAEHTLPQKRGQITLTGAANCVQPGWRNSPVGARPAWAPRAGDWVRIADHPADEPRRIIETSYDHDSRTITLTVGTTPFKLDAIIERLAAQSVGAL